MFKPIAKLLKALSSNRDPGAIAWGFASGLLLGFMPKNNALWYLLFIFVLFMRIQRGAFALALIVGSLLTPALDVTFLKVGEYILLREDLRSTYIRLLGIPFVAFTKLNNTLVMGSFVCGLLAFIPAYVFARLFVFVWRRYLGSAFRKLKFLQMIKQVPLVEKIIAMVEEA